jgi:hypothetical protein
MSDIKRTLQQALDNAQRIKEELPYLIQPENSCYDMILLDDEIQRLEALLEKKDVEIIESGKSLNRTLLALKACQENVVDYENACRQKQEIIDSSTPLIHELTGELQKANEQLAKFKDCVAVPRDVYSGIACEIEELLACDGLNMIKPKLAKQFLKSSEIK